METQTIFKIKEEEKNPNLLYFEDNTTMPIFSVRSQFRDIRAEYHQQMNFAIGSYPESVRLAKIYFLNTYNIPFSAWDYLTNKGK